MPISKCEEIEILNKYLKYLDYDLDIILERLALADSPDEREERDTFD